MKYDKKTLREVLARLEYLEDCYIGKHKEGYSEGMMNVRWQVVDMLGELENERKYRFWK